MAFKIVDSKPINTVYALVGTGGVVDGGLVVLGGSDGSRTVISATAGFSTTASLLVGIARSTVASASYVQVDLVSGHEVEADFTGSSKTTVAVTDAMTAFDISTDLLINLDDTSGGSFVFMGGPAGYGYNNTNLKVRGVFTQASLYV